MSTHPKLEQYLTQLDKSLEGIAVSDRADIITEIRSHVLEAQEREPEKSIESILTSMGEPESVGNRYLIERGLKLGKPSKTPMVKWLTIGFLGTFGILTIAMIIVLFKFSPLIKVDEKNGSVQILGGLIDVKEDTGFKNRLNGKNNLDVTAQTKLIILFKNGNFTFKSTGENKLIWNCDTRFNNQEHEIEKDFVKFNFNDVNCEITIPKQLLLEIEGKNAKIVMDSISSPVSAIIKNGLINFIPNVSENYKYDLNVKNGMSDSFESSDEVASIPIKIKITNGAITKK